MAGGSGEDDKAADGRAMGPVGDHPGAHTVDPEIPPAPVTNPKRSSDWTVSDRRGPLNAVPPIEDDVERFVPGSEVDSEGAHDITAASEPPASTLAPHSPSTSGASSAAPQHPAAGHTAVEDAANGASVSEPRSTSARPPSASPPAMATQAPRRSFMPLALGIILGALIGAGSAALVYTQFPVSIDKSSKADSGTIAALSSRVDALDKRPDSQPSLAKMKGQLDELSSKVAALDKRTAIPAATPIAASPAASSPAASSPPVPGPGAPGPSAASPKPNASMPTQPGDATTGLDAKIAALQASVDTLQKQNGSRELAGKLEALQASLTGVQTLASNARTNVDALKSQQHALDGKLGDLQTAVGGAQKQASAAQSGVETLQNEQKNLAGKLGAPALAVVADSLVGQIEGGKPYTTQADALASLGADPVKVALLRQNASSGVPSAQALLAKFDPLVDAIVATGSKAPANADFANRLKHGLFGLVSVRRTDETTGSDLSSRVALIRSDLAHNDVVGAYAVWTALPADAQQRSDAWGASAKTSVEAISAARGLQNQSIGSLAAKKS